MEDYPRSVAELETILKRRRQSPSELLPRVHLVASLLKRWLLGTHQGAVNRDHLAYYLDEFTFRFNRRRSRFGARCSIACFNRLLLSHRNPTKASLEVRGTSENHNILGQLESKKYPNSPETRAVASPFNPTYCPKLDHRQLNRSIRWA